jgi:hypothetical protein
LFGCHQKESKFDFVYVVVPEPVVRLRARSPIQLGKAVPTEELVAEGLEVSTSIKPFRVPVPEMVLKFKL